MCKEIDTANRVETYMQWRVILHKNTFILIVVIFSGELPSLPFFYKTRIKSSNREA